MIFAALEKDDTTGITVEACDERVRKLWQMYRATDSPARRGLIMGRIDDTLEVRLLLEP